MRKAAAPITGGMICPPFDAAASIAPHDLECHVGQELVSSHSVKRPAKEDERHDDACSHVQGKTENAARIEIKIRGDALPGGASGIKQPGKQIRELSVENTWHGTPYQTPSGDAARGFEDQEDGQSA